MIRASLPCLLLAAAHLAAADFPLEDYVPADFHRRYLSVSPGLNWSRYDRESDVYQPGVESVNEDRSGGIGLNYGSVRNSRKLRWDVSTGGRLGLRGGDGAEKRTDPGLAGSGSRFDQTGDNLDANLGGFSRMSGKWHARERISIQASGAADFHWLPTGERNGSGWNLIPLDGRGDSALFNSFDNEYGNSEITFRTTASLGAGYGRLEEVTFAETGMHLLDRVEEVTGRRVRLGKGGMRDLEAFVEARRKRRSFFDARRAAHYDVESVCLFLRDRGLDSLPPRAVLEMADEWRHAGRVRRFTGWELRMVPFLHATWEDHRREENREDFQRRVALDSVGDPAALTPAAPVPGATRTFAAETRSWRSQTQYGAGLEAAWRRPWRRFWQFDMDAWARYGLESQESGFHARRDTGGTDDQRSDRYASFSYPRMESGASASATWLPTSRTLVGAMLDGRVNRKLDYLDPGDAAWLFGASGAEVEQDVLDWTLSLGLHARYHLDDRLAFWGNLNAGVERRDSRDEGEAGMGEFPVTLPRRLESSRMNASLMGGLTWYLF